MQTAAVAKQVGGRAFSYLTVRRGRPPAFYESGHSTTKRYAYRSPIAFMTSRTQKRDEILEEQCAVVAALIIAIRPVYGSASARQRALLETIVGAGLWYIPKPSRAWTGFMSLGALRAFHPDSGVDRPKLSEEHIYPRKVAAQLLLEDLALDAASLASAFREKYGRVHLITSEENKMVQPHQRAGVFVSPEAAYVSAGIQLVEIAEEDLRLVKRRDRERIDSILSAAGPKAGIRAANA